VDTSPADWNKERQGSRTIRQHQMPMRASQIWSCISGGPGATDEHGEKAERAGVQYGLSNDDGGDGYEQANHGHGKAWDRPIAAK